MIPTDKESRIILGLFTAGKVLSIIGVVLLVLGCCSLVLIAYFILF